MAVLQNNLFGRSQSEQPYNGWAKYSDRATEQQLIGRGRRLVLLDSSRSAWEKNYARRLFRNRDKVRFSAKKSGHRDRL